MPRGRRWTEIGLSEDPAVELLEGLGYTYVKPETLEAERQTLKDVVLADRLAKGIKKLNPWIGTDNTSKAVRAVTSVQAASLIEANEKQYTTLTYGISLEQDLGDGKRSHSVRFIDFENPENNELLVTRQFRVKGSRKQIIPDVVIFINGIPLVVMECKSPTIGDKWFHEAIDQLHRYQESESQYRGLVPM